MNHLIILKDEDIFPPDLKHQENSWESTERIAVRVIAIDDNGKIALCGIKYKFLPGGGVDEGETLDIAAVRECKEEIGCDVVIEKEIGTSEEYRQNGKRHQISHCFVGRVVGEKGRPQSTQDDEQNMKVYWHTKEEVLKILDDQIKTIPFESYNPCFNVRVHEMFIKKYIAALN